MKLRHSHCLLALNCHSAAILTCTSVHFYCEVYLVMRIILIVGVVLHQSISDVTVLTCNFCNMLCCDFLFIAMAFRPCANKMITYLLT